MEMDVDHVPKPSSSSSSSSATTTTAATTVFTSIREGLPWVEKYRPSELDEILAHEDIIQTVKTLIQQNRMPHLLFYGPPGTGKTTTILACARMLYGPNYQNFVMELNASDDRGIGVVRNQIKDFASTKQIFSNVPFKMIILDEADQMTHDAQAALRRIIEKFTRNVRFCFVCNHVNKITSAVQSRCTRFRFGPLKRTQVLDRLRFIATHEKMDASEDGLLAVYRLSNGDMRKCINILQATFTSSQGVVHEDQVYLVTGQPSPKEIRQIVEIMMNSDFSTALKSVEEVRQSKGLAISDILTNVSQLVLKLALPKEVSSFLIQALADVEYQLAYANSEKVHFSAMVGAFQVARLATAQRRSVSELLTPPVCPP